MAEGFSFEKVGPGRLEYLREMQLGELKGNVQEFNEEGIITYGADFVGIAKDGENAGYACIGTYGCFKNIILEYYIISKYRSNSGEILRQLAESADAGSGL